MDDKYFENYVIYEGEKFSVFFHAESESVSNVCDYFEKCDQETQASLLYLVKRISDIGRIYDKTKFRIEDKKNKIYAFKPKKERFFCFFFYEKRIIIISAYRKRGDKLNRDELKKAVKIKRYYME